MAYEIWKPDGTTEIACSAVCNEVTRDSQDKCTAKLSIRFYVTKEYQDGVSARYGAAAVAKLGGFLEARPIDGSNIWTLVPDGMRYSANGRTGPSTFKIGSSSPGALKQAITVRFTWKPSADTAVRFTKDVKITLNVPAWNPSDIVDDGKTTCPCGSTTVHPVVAGDTLWGIARAHLGSGATDPKIQSMVDKLASLNKLKNPDSIYVGQKIKLVETETAPTVISSAVEINQFGVLSTSDNKTLLATWDWSKADTESYKVHWDYDTGNGVWLKGNHSSLTIDEDDPEMAQQSTYSIPEGAVKVRFKVKPISKKNKDSSGKESYCWTTGWSREQVWTNQTPLSTPSTPSVKIERNKLTATLDNIDINGATSIIFQIVKDNSEKSLYTSDPVAIVTGRASYSYDVNYGAEYKVRCKAYNSDNKNMSEWSDYSANTGTSPATPSSAPSLRAVSETSINVSWSEVNTATTYDIEYATNEDHFDTTDDTTVKSGIESTTWELTGLESGTTYFVRIRAVNDQGNSGWSDVNSIIIGTIPAAPTTWSSTTTAVVKEPVMLYWIHNTEDGSSQKLAELEVTVNNQNPLVFVIKNLTSDDDKDKTRYCEVDTETGTLRWTEDDGEQTRSLGASFDEGTQLKWRVRTAGITSEYGDWSVERTIEVYATPTLELHVTTLFDEEITVLENFPFLINAIAGPNTQTPTGYHLEIVANKSYETVDNVGNPKIVSSGDTVYSKYFDTDYRLLVEMSASNIDLENNIPYTANCTVSMNSGLTATASKPFTVSWFATQYTPNAEISVDKESFTAYIRPYCELVELAYHEVEYTDEQYNVTDRFHNYIHGTLVNKYDRGDVINAPEGDIELVKDTFTSDGDQVYTYIDADGNKAYCAIVDEVYYSARMGGAKTTTGEQVYKGIAPNGDEVHYCMIRHSTNVDEAYLSVYRREYDGSFTEIASYLNGYENTTVVDPHPALDYARYRIVATDATTGAVSYYDLPGYPVSGNAVVIQWNEEWSEFDAVEDAVVEKPAWTGSLLKLPYNVDVSDNHQPDIELVEYIGRSHPLSYYGTQLGTTATWNVVIPKSDKETLYALRRLAIWMGDVYVREPSGSGYWANVTVSFSQKHKDMTIPVTLSITRVEGGV